GFALPHGASLTAEVYGVVPFGTVDAALGANGFDGVYVAHAFDVGPAASGSLSYSGIAAFTLP
ncbi:MAG TPA: hypothetical protein VHS09_09355, partial [Polyangiaceae bacterium]|nr:hypothetical protein [Polyangiaceae bacterium]